MIDSSKITQVLPYSDEVTDKAKTLRKALTQINAASERMLNSDIVGFSMSFENNQLVTNATYSNGGQFKYSYPLTVNMMNEGVEALINIYASDLQSQIDNLDTE